MSIEAPQKTTLELAGAEEPHTAHVKCQKCGEAITVKFGNLTRAEAEAKIAELDHTPMSCPGYHVELGGWRRLWNLDAALEAVYGTEASHDPIAS